MPHKPSTRKEIRRIDNKKERAAVRQALDGGHANQPQGMNWSSKLDPVPLLDESNRRPSRRKKGCPKNKGGKHVPTSKGITRGSGEWARTYVYTVCKHCGKHKWGRGKGEWEEAPAPAPASGDHWAYHNIIARLGNGLCDCASCMKKLDAETQP